jgi:protein-S-isoprenylcysteine O-methyltransferase Ste14
VDARRRFGAIGVKDASRQMESSPSLPDGSLRAWLRPIPLSARMFFYGVFFLSAVLIGLPWLAYRIDVHLPACHWEIGWLRLIGAALFVVGLSTYIRSSYVLSSCGQGAYVEFDPPQEFVSKGPYRWVRNPIAACVVLMLLGEAVAFSSTGILLLFVAAIPLAHLQVVLLEEPLLLKRFGRTYAEYQARVPRWLPKRPREGSS